MRNSLSTAILAASQLAAASARAQTWEDPIRILGTAFANDFDSCAEPPQPLVIEGFYLHAPAVIYAVTRVHLGGLPPPAAWSVSVSPWNSDLSLWVCQYRNGFDVGGCVDASDNPGPGASEHVTVPRGWGSYYVIVTASPYVQLPDCGEYQLQAFRE